MTNEESWNSYVQDNFLEPELPDWRAEFDVDVKRERGDTYEITVLLTNRSPSGEHQTIGDSDREFPNWASDFNLYEVTLSAKPSESLIPYELEQIPDSFRYDRTVPVLGRNCSARVSGGQIHSTFAPIAETKRVFPRQEFDGQNIQTDFASLCNNPLPILNRLVDMAEQWTFDNWDENDLRSQAEEEDWPRDMLEEALEEKRRAKEEIEWLKEGLSTLEDTSLRRAFRLMNETMGLITEDKSYDSWYPFQLAFIIGCLPGVLDPENSPEVDILWFKTGGGKTEAYLGLNLVHMFYERLNGRTSGSQTWARFPLRLLSLQQSQRFAESVINAEVVRRRYPEDLSGDPFSIGFFVGSSLTPNRIRMPDDKYYSGWDPTDQQTIETCRVLEECPACRCDEQPDITFDEEHHTLVHECRNEDCPLFGDWLPIYVVDDDIYRWAPTVIVGTVDKLAQIGLNKSFRVLLGQSKCFCPTHGYSHLDDACPRYWDCEQDVEAVGDGFKGINFEIQDELHLINESLGALDANYETLFQTINSLLSDQEIRIVAATATIEGYQEQADHLYRRSSRRFPLPGPTKGESFWAVRNEEKTLRNYVGILPRGTTMLDVSFLIAKSHWEYIRYGLDHTDDFCQKRLNIDEENSDLVYELLRDMYETLVTYSLRKQDLERFAKDIEDDPMISPDQRNYERVTGDVSNISPILEKLEDPPDNPNERIRILGATSAISHGVDIDRLNIMTVMGMPTGTGEFIQATARVGREIPGLVFSLINPARERDVSHYRYFNKYAEYLDRLVEPVPVNRESLPVLKRVLPGGISAFLLQYYEPEWLDQTGERLWQISDVADAVSEGLIQDDFLIHNLKRAFSVGEDAPRFSRHRDYIDRKIEDVLTDIQVSSNSNDNLMDFFEPPIPRSLRDLEPTMEIIGEK